MGDLAYIYAMLHQEAITNCPIVTREPVKPSNGIKVVNHSVYLDYRVNGYSSAVLFDDSIPF